MPSSPYDGSLHATCRRYEGYDGPVPATLRHNGSTHDEFTGGDAVAVLGFDDAIEGYCKSIVRQQGGRHDRATPAAQGDGRRMQEYAHDCVLASRNILLLFGDNVHNTGAGYNSCRNFEWQMCAAMGRLPGQRSPTIIFAKAPSELDISTPKRSGGRPLEKCGGYSPAGCWAGAYANDDIYFLETCLYSMVCANNDELFRVKEREPFHCRVSEAGLRRLQAYLTGSSG